MIDKILETDLADLKRGYKYSSDSGRYVCSLCGVEFEEGEVFRVDDRYFTAEKMMRTHMEREHTDILDRLMSADKKYTGLTENQASILKMFYLGLADAEIAKQTGIATATVRHQRFTFREKAKQAKLYLAIYDLVFSGNGPSRLVDAHRGATMLDDRYFITQDEANSVLKIMFSSLEPLKLHTFPAKEKKKIIVLKKIREQFGNDRKYSEKEVNEILKPIYDDFATIRRALIEYGFMDRTKDRSEYWAK